MSADIKNLSYATTEPIPTTTLGPLTITVMATLALLTCFILNCGRIRRQVNNRRLDKFYKRQRLISGNSTPSVDRMEQGSVSTGTQLATHLDPCSSILSTSGWSSTSTLTAQSAYDPKVSGGDHDMDTHQLSVVQPDLARLPTGPKRCGSTKTLVPPDQLELPVPRDWHVVEKYDEERGQCPWGMLPPGVQVTPHECDLTFHDHHPAPNYYYY